MFSWYLYNIYKGRYYNTYSVHGLLVLISILKKIFIYKVTYTLYAA